jgi:hypothetical protein
MGALISKQQQVAVQERQRTLSIHPDDWRGKHYNEVVAFLKQKYPGIHVTVQAEKTDAGGADLREFERPLSFQEGDAHIVIVYNAVKETILGFYEA